MAQYLLQTQRLAIEQAEKLLSFDIGIKTD